MLESIPEAQIIVVISLWELKKQTLKFSQMCREAEDFILK
jgi:hypothetical protein